MELIDVAHGGCCGSIHFGFDQKEHRTQLTSVIVEPDVPRWTMSYELFLIHS